MEIDNQSVPKLMKSQKKSYYKGKRKYCNNSLKVVYISSPMKVKTSASKFRSLVQQLTGKNSDISRYVDEDSVDGATHNNVKLSMSNQYQILPSISTEDTSTSKESFMGSTDNLFDPQIEELFASIFSLDSFGETSQLDVLECHDELLLS